MGKSAGRKGEVESQLLARVSDVATLACHAVPGCDAASVTVLRRPGDLVVLAETDAAVRAVDRVQASSSEGPSLLAAREGVPVVVEDHGTDGRWPWVDQEAVRGGLRSTLCLPLRRADEVVGALCLHSRRPGSFGPRAERVGRTFAEQAAAALVDAAAAREVVRRGVADRRIAEVLQRDLLPVADSLAGTSAAGRLLAADPDARVGGDWYDTFPLQDHQIGLAVGDVAGHDVEAAAVMGRFRSALRSYAFEGGSPSNVVDRLDRFARGFDMTLTTVVYATLVPQARGALLMLSNAGHVPPLLREPGGRVSSVTEGASWVLGAPTEELGPREDGIRWLPSGSSLVLYTDGLIARSDRRLDDGLGLLERSLRAATDDEAPDQLCDRLLSDTAGGPLLDDAAVLVVRIS